MAEENTWHGKVAIVTGGSSGIGKATVLALLARGARVVVTGRNQAKLEELARQHENLEPVRADSADPKTAVSIVAAALSKWDRLDLLINSAGAGMPLPIERYDDETITEICKVNIVAPSLLVKESTAALRKTRGAIVNIGTAVSRNAAPQLAHYAATKAALEHLTRTWAIEMASDRIRVNLVAPGPFKSGALRAMMGLPEELAQSIEETEAAQVPLGRRGTTSDLVPWILRLGNSENEWLTGQVVTIDGGWSQRT